MEIEKSLCPRDFCPPFSAPRIERAIDACPRELEGKAGRRSEGGVTRRAKSAQNNETRAMGARMYLSHKRDLESRRDCHDKSAIAGLPRAAAYVRSMEQ